MKIIHLSAECYPVAKVGGLSDVVGALPKYQNKIGHESQVIMPFYKNEFTEKYAFSSIYEGTLSLGDHILDYSILKLKKNKLGFKIFFVDIPDLLHTDFIYSSEDTERFLAFQIAVLDWMLTLETYPDIVHCHDHHTGLVPFMLQECYRYESFRTIPCVMTIHNAQYQGWFSHDKVNLIPEFDFQNVGLLDWDGVINPLAAGIKCAWRVNTVSPSYMEELKTNANGLEQLLQAESDKCIGILNGIDSAVWNPKIDTFIPVNYDVRSVDSGKSNNKNYLCKTFNLDPNKPLFAFIGRLVNEKGVDVLFETFKQCLEKENLNILLLGSGNHAVEQELNMLKKKYEGVYNTYIGYNEKLSHIVYAGADFLLMPSRVEPCGLNQMYALKYGTVPIVRCIGGLKDTITDISKSNGFGICHSDLTPQAISNAVGRAITLYEDKVKYKKIKKQIMKIDYSWESSANTYINFYNAISKLEQV